MSLERLNLVEMAKKKRHLYLLEKLQSGKLSRPELKELEKFEGHEPPSGIVDTHEKIAKAFRVSVRTVYFWIRDGMPSRQDGKFDIEEIKLWRESKNKKPEKKESALWDNKYREYKALLAEIEYKKRIGELLDKNEVEKGRIQRIIMVKRKLLSLPKQLAPQLVGMEIHKIELIIDTRIKEVINEFARNDQKSKTKQKRN